MSVWRNTGKLLTNLYTWLACSRLSVSGDRLECSTGWVMSGVWYRKGHHYLFLYQTSLVPRCFPIHPHWPRAWNRLTYGWLLIPEQFETAAEEFQKCLDLQVKHLDPDDRLIAETYPYNICWTEELKIQCTVNSFWLNFLSVLIAVETLSWVFNVSSQLKQKKWVNQGVH